MLEYILSFFMAFLAALIHAVAGFGFAIVFMMIMPYAVGLIKAETISAITAFPQAVLIWAHERKFTKYQKIIPVVIPYILVSTLVIRLLGSINLAGLKIGFGVFLILMGLYFIFLNKKLSLKPHVYIGIICGILAGASNGFFAIGGPFLALYYLSQAKEHDEYIANLNFTLMLTTLTGAAMRIISGYFSTDLILVILVALIGMFLGSKAGIIIKKKVNPEILKKVVYGLIILSGISSILGVVIHNLSK